MSSAKIKAGGNNPYWFIVDQEDFHKVKNNKWSLTNGYPSRRITAGNGVSFMQYLHHEIIGYPEEGLVVDHINRNKLDNRKSNLRFVTKQINALNSKRKPRGICYDRTHGKWKAYLDLIEMGKPKHRVNIGTFSSREEAEQARENYISTTMKKEDE